MNEAPRYKVTDLGDRVAIDLFDFGSRGGAAMSGIQSHGEGGGVKVRTGAGGKLRPGVGRMGGDHHGVDYPESTEGARLAGFIQQSVVDAADSIKTDRRGILLSVWFWIGSACF